jgi:hypothetical protein
MPETTQPPKRRRQSKESPAQSVAGDSMRDESLRSEIARRAHEISQSDTAGSDEENWLRAEREVRHA